jgi:hypothetical protein
VDERRRSSGGADEFMEDPRRSFLRRPSNSSSNVPSTSGSSIWLVLLEQFRLCAELCAEFYIKLAVNVA